MYSIEKHEIYCDYIKYNVTMSIKFAEKPIKKPIEKRCSKWDNCDNRQYCKHGKI